MRAVDKQSEMRPDRMEPIMPADVRVTRQNLRLAYEVSYDLHLTHDRAFETHWQTYAPCYQAAYQSIVTYRPTFKHYLDIGSGISVSSLVLPDPSAFVGMDYSLNSMRAARARFPVASFVVADGLNLPLATGSMDAAICIGSMEHFEDVLHGIEEAWRLLMPGGIFVLNIPNAFDLPLYFFTNLTRLARFRDRLLRRKAIPQPVFDGADLSPEISKRVDFTQGRAPSWPVQAIVLTLSLLGMIVHSLLGRSPIPTDDHKLYTHQPVDRVFSTREMNQLIRQAGFEILDHRTISPYHLAYPGFDKLLRVILPPGWHSAHHYVLRK
jgi:ubiquinone/menaquinone biosynthesis C-methylase UbiE